MAVKKRTNEQQKAVDTNKGIADFIYHFYNNVVGVKPDTTSYSAGQKILGSLMNPTDPNMRAYSYDELVFTCAYLMSKGVVLKTLSLLYWPSLVSSIVNKDWVLSDNIISKLIDQQQKEGIYSEVAIQRMIPGGW